MSAKTVELRKKPQQKRALQRRQQILDCSIDILRDEGLEKLNTVYVSETLGISVGSLYRYFPNKQSILHTLAEQWLEANRCALQEVALWPLESMDLITFVRDFLDYLFPVYYKERELTLLLQTIMEVPELREVEKQHDDFVIGFQAKFFKRLGVGKSRTERLRISEVMLNQGHFGLMLSLTQGAKMRQRTLDDLHAILLCVLERHSC